MTRLRIVAACLVLAGVPACGGDSEPEPEPSPDADTSPFANTACAVEDKVGGFTVLVTDLATNISGAVRDGVRPGDIRTVVATDGACALTEPRQLFCDPPCASGETCGGGGACVPTPRNQNVGTVTISGLDLASESDVTLEPHPVNASYNGPGGLPRPAFSPQAQLSLSAAGGDHAGFSLRGVGFAPLTAPDAPVQMKSGEVLQLVWDAPAEAGATEIHIALDIATHGGTPGQIDCVVPDTGAFAIPEPLVTALLDRGFAGFPALSYTRFSVDATDHDLGCIEFRVSSRFVAQLEIEGLISCSDDMPCPEGMTCQPGQFCE